MLTAAAMVDNLAEKVDECLSLIGVFEYCCVQLGLHGVPGCPLFRDCLSAEVNGRTVGTFRIVCYIVGVRY